VSPDWRELWTASPRRNVAVVDTATKKLVQVLDAKVIGANRVKFIPMANMFWFPALLIRPVAASWSSMFARAQGTEAHRRPNRCRWHRHAAR
jgi:hypothetical protein